jgi:hypothetical protein
MKELPPFRKTLTAHHGDRPLGPVTIARLDAQARMDAAGVDLADLQLKLTLAGEEQLGNLIAGIATARREGKLDLVSDAMNEVFGVLGAEAAEKVKGIDPKEFFGPEGPLNNPRGGKP